MKKYEMSSLERKLRKLAVACMTNGHMMRVRSHSEADKAESLGAVRLLGEASAAGSIPTLFENDDSGVLHAHCEAYNAGGLRVPDEYVLRQAHSERDGLPSFLFVNSVQELSKALLHEPFLLVATDHNLIPNIRAHLPDPLLPVYLSVSSMPDAEAAYLGRADHVPDGLLLNFVPEPWEIDNLYRVQGRIPSGWTRNSERLIGVLSLQGDYRLHIRDLRNVVLQNPVEAQVGVVPVKTIDELNQVDALVLPGGWATVQTRMMQALRITSEIDRFAQVKSDEKRNPVLAICAGMILARLKNGIKCEHRHSFGWIPMLINNNDLNGVYAVTGFGDSVLFSEAPVAIPLAENSDAPFEILATIATSGEDHDKIVGLRYKNVTAFAFHEGIHDVFLKTCLRAWVQ